MRGGQHGDIVSQLFVPFLGKDITLLIRAVQKKPN